MKLKNILIVVKDIEKAKQFYHDLFGLDVVLNQDGNVILTEGLIVLLTGSLCIFVSIRIKKVH